MLSICPGVPTHTARCTTDSTTAGTGRSAFASGRHPRRHAQSPPQYPCQALGSDGSHQALGTSIRSRERTQDSNGNRLAQEQRAAELHQALADEWLQAIKAPPELQQPKVFVFVRHGHSTWNEQSRIQVSTVLHKLPCHSVWVFEYSWQC